MGIVESIGWIVIIFGSFYLLLGYISGKESKKRNLQELIQNNSKCQELIRKETKIIHGINGKILRIESNPIFNCEGEIINQKLKKELLQIINDPVEEQNTLENIRKKQLQKEKSEQESEVLWRNRRKIGYKYEIEIFEIFGSKQELSTDKLLLLIESKFNVSDEKAIDIFNIWKANGLICECAWNSNNYEVGWPLTFAYDCIDKNDLSREKWLNQNNITLEPESKEYLDYVR